jgi:hypothetical protein
MAAIASYKVGVTRAARKGPVRSLTLQLAEPEGDLRQVSLFFYEDAPPSLGFVNHETGFVVANLRLVDFDASYRILNTENPVFIHWRTDPEEARLISIDLSTSEEPLGEGPPHRTP